MQTAPSPVEYLIAFAVCIAIGTVVGWRAKSRQVQGKSVF